MLFLNGKPIWIILADVPCNHVILMTGRECHLLNCILMMNIDAFFFVFRASKYDCIIILMCSCCLQNIALVLQVCMLGLLSLLQISKPLIHIVLLLQILIDKILEKLQC